MNQLKLLVCDIDGTLVDAEGQLPQRNVGAVRELGAVGVQLALATVRKRDTAHLVLDRLDVPCALVCEGGAVVYDVEGGLLRELALPWDVADKIAALADERGFPLATTIGGVNFYGPGFGRGDLRVYGEPVQRNREVLAQAPTRLLVQDEDAVQLIAQLFADVPLSIVRHYQADGSFIDAGITHAGATKAQAVTYLLGQLQFGWEDVMAIGDSESDLEMIQLRRIGVAVGDAISIVTEAADYVSATAAEAGVATAIQRFILTPTEP